MAQKQRRVPVNLIAGSLGVGKTTAINHLIRTRPEGARWAVLVNEYGQIGLDAALMASEDEGVAVREVAGGCICCTAGFMFGVSLMLLLDQGPDRLIIEPTGLATLASILETLARPGIRERVDVRSVICLVDPRTPDLKALPVEVADQVEAADVLLASRSDLATAEQLQAFEAWAEDLYPQKRFVGVIRHGLMPAALLDLGGVMAQAPGALVLGDQVSGDQAGAARERHHHHSEGTAGTGEATQAPALASEGEPVIRAHHVSSLAVALGWSIWAARIFEWARVEAWVEGLTGHSGFKRLKAAIHTDGGWVSVNVADGAASVRPSAHRRDSRLEIIWVGGEAPAPEAVEGGLLSCLYSP